MGVEAGHVQITEFSREVIPSINWMIEDLFCQYGVDMPYFLLDFDFPDYAERPDWILGYRPDWYLPEWKSYWPTYSNQWPNWFETTGYDFNLDWGPYGHYLTWLNELMGLLFDEAGLPRWQMPDFSPSSWEMFNSQIAQLYESVTEVFTALWNDGEKLLDSMLKTHIGNTYQQAKDAYEANGIAERGYGSEPDGSTPSRGIVNWGVFTYGGGTVYEIWACKTCFSFDTTTASSGHTTATLSIPVNELGTSGGNPTLYLYKTSRYADPDYNWTEGTKVGEHVFDGTEEGTTIEITFDITHVSIGSYSHYRLSIKDMDDLTYIDAPIPEGIDNMKHQSVKPDYDNLKLTLS